LPARAARFKPRKAPSQRRSTDTVEAILGAAARILVSRGWAGLTTNHVAKRAGVSIGTLYEYFPGKEALATALVERHIDEAERVLTERSTNLATLGRAPSIEELARTLVRAMLELHEQAPRLHRVLFEEVPHAPATRTRLRDLEDAQIDVLATLLESMTDVQREDPKLSARIVANILEATVHRWACDPTGDPIPREKLEIELIRLVSTYLERA
jgi:AcrR family transcriptional regulator